MKALKLKKTVFAMTFLAVGALIDSVLSSPPPVKRLDLFDAQGNNLMYVTFQYDPATGKNTSYTVYFSDSTFTRTVNVFQNEAGVCTREAALNFTDDTVFKSTFNPNGNNTDMVVKDQFNIDQFGGPVSYANAGGGVYNFSQNGAAINQMKYKYSSTGSLKEVDVYDNTGTNLMYFGIFDTASVGVLSPNANHSAPRPSFQLKGNDALVWNFAIDREAFVKCEAMSLSGRRIAVLFSGELPAGVHSKTLRMGTLNSLTNGVYGIAMSVDNKPVATDKFIVQRIRGGLR